jgi:class 3 adenylate cyclase/tetratricopeptide (TPR) repeat protein
MRALNAFLPEDRLRALATRTSLDPNPTGCVLVTDLSGFTALTAFLEETAGPRLGPEELIDGLNRIYEAFVSEVESRRGSVVTFIGDALTCWFENDTGARALTAAFGIQQAAARLGSFGSTHGETLRVKVCVTSGRVQRCAVGDPGIQRIDVLAGSPVDRAFLGQSLAQQGETLVSEDVLLAIRSVATSRRTREAGGVKFGVVEALTNSSVADPWPDLSEQSPSEDLLRPWFLAPVWAGLKNGVEAFSAETRLTSALFQQLPALDFDHDAAAPQRLDEAFRRVQSVVSQRGGAVMSVTTGDKGNVVYSSFGAVLALEDDADRAVSAALELCPPDGAGTIVRAGLSRGRMRVGAYGSRSRRTFGSLGGETNIAARLMDRAKPGQTLVAERAMKLARGRHSFRALGEFPLKGLVKPLGLYELTGRRAASVATEASPLIARLQELAQFDAALQTLSEGNGGVVIVEGEAGIGKSRLVAEVIKRAAFRSIRILSGQADDVERSTPYFPVRSVVRQLFELDDGLSPAAFSAKILESLAASPELTDLAPLLRAVLPVELPETAVTRQLAGHLRAENLRKLLVGVCRLVTAKQPTLLVLEDAHSFDAASLSLCDALAREVPRLLVMTSVRTQTELPAELATLPAFTTARRVTLTGLAPSALLSVACHRLGITELPPAVAAAVSEATRGNPYFAQELASWFRDRGLSTPLTNDPSDAVPDSIAATITNRIDRLSKGQQLTIKVASVLGRSFPAAALAAVHPAAPEPEAFARELQSLRDANLLEEADEGRTQTFKHSLLRDTAYGLLLVSQRRDLHARIARWYEASQRLPETYPKLAHHWGEAGDLEQQLKYLELAADQALATGAFSEASTLLTRAIECSGTGDSALAPARRRASWQARLGHAYTARALFGPAREHLELSLGLFGLPLPRGLAAQIAGILWQVAIQVMHRFRSAPSLVERSEERREVLSSCSQSHKDLTFAYYFSGEKLRHLYSAATQLNLAERVGETPELSDGLIHFSVLTGMVGLKGVAESYYDRAIDLAQRLKLDASYAWVRLGGAGFRQGLGLWERAGADAREARDIYERLGDKYQYGYSAMMVAANEFFTGDMKAAAESFRILRELAPRSENVVHRGHGNIFGGIVAFHRGYDTEADALVHEGAQLLESTNDIASKIVVHGQLARAAAAANRDEEANREIATALGLMAQGIPTGFWAVEGYVATLDALLTLAARAGATQRRQVIERLQELKKQIGRLSLVFPVTRPAVLLVSGHLARMRGRDAAAREAFLKSAAESKRLGMRVDLGRALLAASEGLEPGQRASLISEATKAFQSGGAFRWLAKDGHALSSGASEQKRIAG